MTVRTILPAPSVMGTQYLAEAHDRLGRLAAADTEHKDMALTYLTGYAPQVFDTVFNATEPVTNYDPGEDLEPFCRSCGDPVGVFLAHGSEYKHYKGVLTPGSKPRPYRADHKPAVGWRTPARSSEATTQ